VKELESLTAIAESLKVKVEVVKVFVLGDENEAVDVEAAKGA
jgi:hypothetical protein